MLDSVVWRRGAYGEECQSEMNHIGDADRPAKFVVRRKLLSWAWVGLRRHLQKIYGSWVGNGSQIHASWEVDGAAETGLTVVHWNIRQCRDGSYHTGHPLLPGHPCHDDNNYIRRDERRARRDDICLEDIRVLSMFK